jgi:hypothetical protein
MNDGLEIMWKEAVVTHFKVLSQYLYGDTGANNETAQSGQSMSRPKFKPCYCHKEIHLRYIVLKSTVFIPNAEILRDPTDNLILI